MLELQTIREVRRLYQQKKGVFRKDNEYRLNTYGKINILFVKTLDYT